MITLENDKALIIKAIMPFYTVFTMSINYPLARFSSWQQGFDSPRDHNQKLKTTTDKVVVFKL